MSDFVRVASVSDIPDAGKELVEVEDRLVALFHVGGKFYAIDDVCTHDGGPLAEGELDGFAIACPSPRSEIRYPRRSLPFLTMPATKPTVAHEVKIEGDEVFIRLKQ